MELRLHKRLGLFAEEPMEREHHNNKLQHFVSERQKLDWAPKKNLGTKRSYWWSRSAIRNPENDFIEKAATLLCEKDKIRSETKIKTRKAEALRENFLQTLAAAVIFPGRNGRNS